MENISRFLIFADPKLSRNSAKIRRRENFPFYGILRTFANLKIYFFLTNYSRRLGRFKICFLVLLSSFQFIDRIFHRSKIIQMSQNELRSQCGQGHTFSYFTENNLSRVMRKPAFCICKNRTADQHLCFRYTYSTIPQLPKSEIPSF